MLWKFGFDRLSGSLKSAGRGVWVEGRRVTLQQPKNGKEQVWLGCDETVIEFFHDGLLRETMKTIQDIP
jgi:hypothetical protein